MDLYDTEIQSGSVNVYNNIVDLGSNQTTNSTTAVQAAGTIFLFTPTKPNVRARYTNMLLDGSGSSVIVNARVHFNGVIANQADYAQHAGVTERPYSCAGSQEGFEIGVEIEISVYWFVNTGTATMYANHPPSIEIIEYD